MSDPGQDEALLVKKARDGDADAFQALVLRHQQEAFRAAYLVLRDADEAEDAAQEAFIRAHAALGRFKPERPFRPWILKIAVNQALTMLKKRKRRHETPLDGPVQGPPYGIEETLIDRERAEQLSAALNEVREKERALIYLRYFLHLNEREMAEYLGCAPGTVKSRLHRALRRLGDVLRKRYPQLLEDEG